jgi:hypothetical protein
MSHRKVEARSSFRGGRWKMSRFLIRIVSLKKKKVHVYRLYSCMAACQNEQKGKKKKKKRGIAKKEKNKKKKKVCLVGYIFNLKK